VFDDFARIAAAIVGAPIGLITLVDDKRQWFKARCGLDVQETPREIAFCSHALRSPDLLVVPDALQDARFASNPLVTSDPAIRFYAGAPLITPDGFTLGTLCVIDRVPRTLLPEHAEALRSLSRRVMDQLELRRRMRAISGAAGERANAIQALRRAVNRQEFVLHYQPKVSAREGHLSGLEALIRWQDPEQGLVAPCNFIPLLEASGLIREVGRWVIDQAVSDCRRWLAQGLAVPRVAVNVSPVQLRQPDFAKQMALALGAGKHDSVDLDIEITEGVFMKQLESTIENLRALRALGVRVAVDDFGTGYSSLRYIARLPIDVLKIDRSFVSALTESADDLAVVSTIITLAHGLDLTVVAEGVETSEQRKLLRLLKVDELQGYLFGRPVPAHEIETLLRSQIFDGSRTWTGTLVRKALGRRS